MKDQKEIDCHEQSFTITKKISESIEEIEKRIILVGSYLKRSRDHFNKLGKVEN